MEVMLMSFKIKITALFAATVLIVSAAGCKHDSGKEESSAPTVSDNSGSSQSTEEVLPENQRVTEKFEDTKLGKYKYVWGDEFNTDTLDLSKWIIESHSSSGRDKLTFEQGDENLSKVFKIQNGAASLIFQRWYDQTNTLIQYAGPAELMTRPTMSWQYGYLEVRLRMSFRKDGNAIWMASGDALNSNKDAYCGLEVDVFETLASTDSVTPNIHLWYKDGRHTDMNGYVYNGKPIKYTFANSYNLAKEFHVYGFEWTPSEMAMYVDGEKYWTLDTTKSFDDDPDISVYNQPIYLMLATGAFTPLNTWHTYAGDEIDNTSLPLDYSVDYVRLYQDSSVKGTQLNIAK